MPERYRTSFFARLPLEISTRGTTVKVSKDTTATVICLLFSPLSLLSFYCSFRFPSVCASTSAKG